MPRRWPRPSAPWCMASPPGSPTCRFPGCSPTTWAARATPGCCRTACPADGIAWYGALPGRRRGCLPERHLGILQAAEIADLDARARPAGRPPAPAPGGDLPPVAFPAAPLPPIDRCWRAGGWPSPGRRLRLHLPGQPGRAGGPRCRAGVLLAPGRRAAAGLRRPVAAGRLSGTARRPAGVNPRWLAEPTAHAAAGKPLLAECGGMMSLFETLTDKGKAPATPALPCCPAIPICRRGWRRSGHPGGGAAGRPVAGHTFHYSKSETPLQPLARATSLTGGGRGGVSARAGRPLPTCIFIFRRTRRAVAVLFGAAA